ERGHGRAEQLGERLGVPGGGVPVERRPVLLPPAPEPGYGLRRVVGVVLSSEQSHGFASSQVARPGAHTAPTARGLGRPGPGVVSEPSWVPDGSSACSPPCRVAWTRPWPRPGSPRRATRSSGYTWPCRPIHAPTGSAPGAAAPWRTPATRAARPT